MYVVIHKSNAEMEEDDGEYLEHLIKMIKDHKYWFYVITSSTIGLQLVTLLFTAGLWRANQINGRNNDAEEGEMNPINSTPSEPTNKLTNGRHDDAEEMEMNAIHSMTDEPSKELTLPLTEC